MQGLGFRAVLLFLYLQWSFVMCAEEASLHSRTFLVTNGVAERGSD